MAAMRCEYKLWLINKELKRRIMAVEMDYISRSVGIRQLPSVPDADIHNRMMAAADTVTHPTEK